MERITRLRSKLERRKGQQTQIESDLKAHNKKLRYDRRDLTKHEQAREIVKSVGLATQQQLEYHFSDIVTSALEAVFPDPYALSVKFVERRGKTECNLQFEGSDGELYEPMGASGGGPIDTASFALRIAAWSMRTPRSRPVFVLDEPFKYLSTDLQPQAGQMLREISEKLGVQLIIVTHEQELELCADRLFEVRQKKGISKVTAGI